MSQQTNFVPPRVPFVDLVTGRIARVWEDFLREIFSRVSGSDPAPITTPDLSIVPLSARIARLESMQTDPTSLYRPYGK